MTGPPSTAADPLASVLLTGDLLDAIARRLGARRFPGVGSSLYDAVPAEHHADLTERLVAALVTRGDFADRAGGLVTTPEVAALLAPVIRGGPYYKIDRTSTDGHQVTALAEADGAVVWHRAEGAYHRFDLLRTDGDLAAALYALLDPSPGQPAPDARPFDRRRSRLTAAGEQPRLVPAQFAQIAETWRATTTVSQVGTPYAGTVALSWLSVIDGGPGQVWLVEPAPDTPEDGILDSDDPVYAVAPAGPAAVRGRLAAWCGTVLAA